jgi:hypothetical protein
MGKFFKTTVLFGDMARIVKFAFYFFNNSQGYFG